MEEEMINYAGLDGITKFVKRQINIETMSGILSVCMKDKPCSTPKPKRSEYPCKFCSFSELDENCKLCNICDCFHAKENIYMIKMKPKCL